jgi:dATP/dGTP diphosphohydrolase
MTETPKADGGGLRFNTGKNQVELIPVEWIWALAMVLTRGAAKYAVRNWERGMKWSYPVGCAFRHMLKFLCGERYDKETGCHHLAMAAWNCLALMTYDIRGIGENDLGPAQLDWLEAVAVEPGPELLEIMRKKIGGK